MRRIDYFTLAMCLFFSWLFSWLCRVKISYLTFDTIITFHHCQKGKPSFCGGKKKACPPFDLSLCFHRGAKLWMRLPRPAEWTHLHHRANVHLSLSTSRPPRAISHADGTREGPSNPPVPNVTVAITDQLADRRVCKEHYSSNTQGFKVKLIETYSFIFSLHHCRDCT